MATAIHNSFFLLQRLFFYSLFLFSNELIYFRYVCQRHACFPDNNTIILELMHILKKGVQTWSFLKQYWTFQWIWRRITNKLLTSWLCYRVTSDSHFICLVCDSVVSVHNVQQSMAFDKTFMFYSFKAFIHHCS